MILVFPHEDTTHTDQGKEMEGIPNDPGWPGADSAPDASATALAVRTASRDVYPGWTIPDGGGNQGESSQRAIEAQIAAAVAGRKPLYFDPWGNEFSRAFAESYRKVLPQGIRVEARDGMLFIYRPDAVRRVLDSDPVFYRREGESDLDSIARVSRDSENGELLGYGARHLMTRPAHEVRIFKGGDLMLFFFVSSPDEKLAARIASERADDFIRAFGWPDVRFEMARVD